MAFVPAVVDAPVAAPCSAAVAYLRVYGPVVALSYLLESAGGGAYQAVASVVVDRAIEILETQMKTNEF